MFRVFGVVNLLGGRDLMGKNTGEREGMTEKGGLLRKRVALEARIVRVGDCELVLERAEVRMTWACQ
jgi:hypothetical protein